MTLTIQDVRRIFSGLEAGSEDAFFAHVAPAVVELRAHGHTRDGMAFDTQNCWLLRFESETIVEVRAYVDTALIQRVMQQEKV